MSDAETDELDALLCGFEPLPNDLLAPNASGTSSSIQSDAPCLHSTSEAPAIEESVASPSSSNVTAEKPADGGRRARYRARSRNELLYLREVVAELERELARWKRRASTAGCGRRLSLPASTQAMVWKALASRQKLERQDAEAENARLRVLLENQLRFAAQLQCLVGSRAGLAGAPRALPRVGIDAADVSVFEAYLSELDDAYARTDAVMREAGLDAEPESPRRVINVRHPTGDGHPSYAEFLDTYVMLSDLETARGNTWEVVMHEYMKRSGVPYESETPQPGARALKFRYPYKWFGRDGFVSVTHTLKTYNEQGRQVAIYRVLSVGEGALAGIATDETGWSVMQPSSADASRTVCRVVTRLTPMRFHRLAPQKSDQAPPQLVEFAKVLFQMGDEDFGTMLDRLQRLSLGSASPAT